MKNIFNIIITVLIILIIILTTLFIKKYMEEEEVRRELNEAIIPRKITSEELVDIEGEITLLKQKYNNDEVYGILSIGNQTNSIPIVKGIDNKYYLNHSLTKEKNMIGSVFIDYRHDDQSRQINVYGHNSNNYETPLKVLEKYLYDKEYYQSNSIIELKIDDEIRKYQIFSVYETLKKGNEEHMQFNYQNELDWLVHFERMHQRSKYKTDMIFSENDNIIVLQTCILDGKYYNKLIILVAKELTN